MAIRNQLNASAVADYGNELNTILAAAPADAAALITALDGVDVPNKAERYKQVLNGWKNRYVGTTAEVTLIDAAIATL